VRVRVARRPASPLRARSVGDGAHALRRLHSHRRRGSRAEVPWPDDEAAPDLAGLGRRRTGMASLLQRARGPLASGKGGSAFTSERLAMYAGGLSPVRGRGAPCNAAAVGYYRANTFANVPEAGETKASSAYTRRQVHRGAFPPKEVFTLLSRYARIAFPNRPLERGCRRRWRPQ
jgi:hypothetical protein